MEFRPDRVAEHHAVCERFRGTAEGDPASKDGSIPTSNAACFQVNATLIALGPARAFGPQLAQYKREVMAPFEGNFHIF